VFTESFFIAKWRYPDNSDKTVPDPHMDGKHSTLVCCDRGFADERVIYTQNANDSRIPPDRRNSGDAVTNTGGHHVQTTIFILALG